MEAGLLGRVSALTEELYTKCSELDQAVADAPKDDSKKTVNYYHDVILAKMDEVRAPGRSAGDAGGQEVLAVPDLLGYPVLRVSDNRAAGRTHAGCGSWKQPAVTAYNTMACTSRTERCGRCTPIFLEEMKNGCHGTCHVGRRRLDTGGGCTGVSIKIRSTCINGRTLKNVRPAFCALNEFSPQTRPCASRPGVL